jgi:hypothetical protein
MPAAVAGMMAGKAMDSACEEDADYTSYTTAVEGAVALNQEFIGAIGAQLGDDVASLQEQTRFQQTSVLGDWRDQLKEFNKQKETLYSKSGVAESGQIEQLLAEQLQTGRRKKKESLTGIEMDASAQRADLERTADRDMRRLQADIAGILSEYAATTGADLGSYEGPDHGPLYEWLN